MKAPPPDSTDRDLDRLLDLEDENDLLRHQLGRVGAGGVDRLIAALDAYLGWVDEPNPAMPTHAQSAVRGQLRHMLNDAARGVR
jgi:hypothetical protein